MTSPSCIASDSIMQCSKQLGPRNWEISDFNGFKTNEGKKALTEDFLFLTVIQLRIPSWELRPLSRAQTLQLEDKCRNLTPLPP